VKYKVGDRVQCTNDTRFHGLVGTIKSLSPWDSAHPYVIHWDNHYPSSDNGGVWGDKHLTPAVIGPEIIEAWRL